jgi:hypothetical protein
VVMKRWRAIPRLVALLFVAAAATLLSPRSPRPCQATFEQVREGMTYDDVCETVGGPPGDYSGGRCIDGWINMRRTRSVTYWTTTESVLSIVFDSDGRAAVVRTYEPTLVPEPPLKERLRVWLGL